jgi:LacI family transcriptional regulator
MATKRRSTLVAVAERAGVSIASVSRVLNGLPTSPDVKRKVEDAAAELDYVPDTVARSLKLGRTEQIAFAVADVGNPVYVSMLHAVEGVVSEAGFRLVISSTGNDPADQIDVVRSVNRGYADGLILVPLRLTDQLLHELASSRIPITVIGTLPPRVALDNVRAESPSGVGLALDHLHAQGCRRIAFVNGPVDTVPGTARLAGYLAAIERLGLSTNAEMQVTADDFTYEAGVTASEALLSQASPDAILAANDLLAVAAMKVLARHGRSVPADVAVVGMDDTQLAELANPSLSSVGLGSTARAEAAADLLLSRLADPSLPARQVAIAPSLTVRESSRRARYGVPARDHPVFGSREGEDR